MLDLNDKLDQINLADIYITFHPKAAEYAFFSSAHGPFFKMDHMLGQKLVNKFKRIKIISSIFSKQSSMKLEIKYPKKTGKFTNMGRLNNMLLDNQWVK